MEIINSTCLIANTNISTDSSFNIITEDGVDALTTESGDNIVLNSKIGDASKFDNDDIRSYHMLEQTVRGTTLANGILTDNLQIVGVNTVFSTDLMIGDEIYLSSNSSFKGKIVSIDGQTLTMNRSMGDGTNQTIVLCTSRTLDLERSENTLTLSTEYDGSNNFMNVTVNSSSSGLLLLEDGIGTSNSAYTGNTSLEGKIKFEHLSTFNNQIPKFIQT